METTISVKDTFTRAFNHQVAHMPADRPSMKWKSINVKLNGVQVATIKQYEHMTEQSLIEYAIAGDTGAIDYLAANGFPGIDWAHAITHVNGRWLPGNEIVLVWDEMKKLKEAHPTATWEQIHAGLQNALDQHNARTRTINPVAAMSPAGRPWHFQQQHALKWGQRGTNRTPPKKKRK